VRGSVLSRTKGETRLELRYFNATDCEKQIGKVLEAALREGRTVVTRQDARALFYSRCRNSTRSRDARGGASPGYSDQP